MNVFDCPGCDRGIFGEDLVLEVQRRGRDKDSFLSAHRKIHKRNQVPKRFARTGSCLNKKVLRGFKGAADLLEHRLLPAAHLAAHLANSRTQRLLRCCEAHSKSSAGAATSGSAVPSEAAP